MNAHAYGDWEVVIGIELHLQLRTKSKIFSSAPNQFSTEPNTNITEVCVALPGTLPVLNERALRYGIRFGLAVGAFVPPLTRFARKSYFYPDLPKGYQISQMDDPVVQGGTVIIQTEGGEEKSVRLVRAHLEEDAGKSLHDRFDVRSGIDMNRAGTPLLEIVSEPDMRSAEEAVAYLKTLHSLALYLQISDGKMSEGSMRADINISIRKKGESHLNPRSEIKNVNSFRFVEKAIDFEVRRHIALFEAGKKPIQETRLFDSTKEETRPMRGKEDAVDYRYHPDPDLPAIAITEVMIAMERTKLPELPLQKRERFVKDLGLSPVDARIISDSHPLAIYFEAALSVCESPSLATSWVLAELLGHLNKAGIPIEESPVSATTLGTLISKVKDGEISGKIGKMLLVALLESPNSDMDDLITQNGWKQVSDKGAIEKLTREVLDAHEKQVAEYLTASEDKQPRMLGFFVGQCMKRSGGTLNPTLLNEALKSALKTRGETS